MYLPVPREQLRFKQESFFSHPALTLFDLEHGSFLVKQRFLEVSLKDRLIIFNEAKQNEAERNDSLSKACSRIMRYCPVSPNSFRCFRWFVPFR